MRSKQMAVVTFASLFLSAMAAPAAEPLKLLFLGDNGHHKPAERFAQLQPVMKERGIELTYSGKVEDLNAETLAKYDGLIVYANTTRISPEQEQALLDYVAGGKGFIPLHCASYCFLNSPKYIELVGAQFQRHGTGTFRTILTDGEHPVMRGFGGFESWDETYVHTKHNEQDRTVLEWREEGDRKEPWTWVRTHGKGRVFYTAWGHDQRTWGNPGFQNLVERGIRWAVGADPGVVPAFADVGQASGRPNGLSTNSAGETPAPQVTAKRTDVKPFEYTEANVPFYPAGQRWGVNSTTPRKMQQPLTAEESLKHFVTPVGFEVKLFVSEPQLEGKPIFMTWDERGRLWVCETYDYPNELQPVGEGRDKIRICEDTDGDGRADKFTVFAEKLSIPTAIAFYRGGAIVQNGTETIYLKDTNGDGRADLKKTLVTGWSMRDTHGEVSNFRYGHDNWYWAMQGYNDSQPVLTDGTRGPRFRQGFFRFKVEGEDDKVAVTEIEFLRSTNNNTWGLGLSEEGIVFGSTANGNPSEHMPIPNRYYEAVRGWSSSGLTGIAETNRFFPITENVRQVDWHGGFTAAAGHALYTARNYPREYWNRTAFVTEPTGHLIATFVLRPEGAGFRSKNSWNLVASDDEWSGPIQAEVGPDGNVWIIDWYNYIVQHNPTPAGFRTGKGAAYETELRDKKHGRIYRLVYQGKASGLPNKSSTTAGWKPAPRELVALLKSDNMQQRMLAQRLLVERGNRDVVPALVALLEDEKVDAIGLNPAAIHALGVLQGLGAIEDGKQSAAAAIGALKHPSSGVRRMAAQVLPASNEALAALLASGVLNDREPQVKLQAILALTKFKPDAAAAKAIVGLLADSTIQNDRILLDAVTAAAAGQEGEFLTAISEAKNAALAAKEATERIAIVAGHVARGEKAEPRPIIAALERAQPEVAAAILNGTARGWPRDRQVTLTPEVEKSLAGLFEKLPPAAKSQVAALAMRWGSQGLSEQIAAMATKLLEEAGKSELAEDQRLAAATQYVELQKNDSAAAKLLDLVTPQSSPELARGLVEALGKSEALAIGVALADRLPSFTPAVRQVALRVLLSRNDWSSSLLEAIQGGKVQLADLSLDQKQALASHPDRQIANRARRLLEAGGSLPNPDRQKVLDELLPLTHETGDAAAGKLVYKNQCSKCHVFAGEGTKIGPDLTGMAVHPKHELLVHLIDPSRSVEGNYRVYTVLTADGVVINGVLASETKTAIELIDSEAKKHIVLREDIENLQTSPKSLMPEGFEKQVKREELRDLLEFLTQRGQYVPIPLDKVATAVSTLGMFNDENSRQERLVFGDWGAKTVEGVPFVLVDPQDSKTKNAVLLYGPQGKLPPTMPRSISLACSFPAKAVHLLSGVAGWAYPYGEKGSHSMTVRLTYADGQAEDHKLLNGEHVADYIRRVDVPGSKHAFDLRGRQIRLLSVPVERSEPLAKIELVKGDDRTAPVVMAVTVETR